jgi:hypothetical protein
MTCNLTVIEGCYRAFDCGSLHAALDRLMVHSKRLANRIVGAQPYATNVPILAGPSVTVDANRDQILSLAEVGCLALLASNTGPLNYLRSTASSLGNRRNCHNGGEHREKPNLIARQLQAGRRWIGCC